MNNWSRERYVRNHGQSTRGYVLRTCNGHHQCLSVRLARLSLASPFFEETALPRLSLGQLIELNTIGSGGGAVSTSTSTNPGASKPQAPNAHYPR